MLDQPHTRSATQAGAARSIQDYIDETPVWSDGTPLPMTPMTAMQWRIWWLAAAGKAFEGMVVFMTGVALPLIAQEFALGAFEHGLVTAASLAGILVGATLLGGLADHYGRKRMFIFEMALFCLFLILLTVSPNFPWLVACLFGVGVALGCDYPTAHVVISESIASRTRGRLVLAAFGFQAVGALFGTAVGYVILANAGDLSAWRWMYGVAVIPALLVLAGRFAIPESPHWLVAQGRGAEAEAAAMALLNRVPPYPRAIALKPAPHHAEGHAKSHKAHRHSALFKKKNRRATILASVPWFLQDLGTYGIGIFTPTILAATIGQSREHAASVSDIVANDMLAAKGAAVIDILLILGIAGAVMLADRVGRIRLQVIGFIGCALGLVIAAQSAGVEDPLRTILIFAGFMLFNFMTNVGPNAQTYLIAGEVFPTKLRGKGAGFAASVGKIGAVLTAFLFPILLNDWGTQPLLYLLAAASIGGAVVTWLFRIETKGMNLEHLDHA